MDRPNTVRHGPTSQTVMRGTMPLFQFKAKTLPSQDIFFAYSNTRPIAVEQSSGFYSLGNTPSLNRTLPRDRQANGPRSIAHLENYRRVTNESQCLCATSQLIPGLLRQSVLRSSGFCGVCLCNRDNLTGDTRHNAQTLLQGNYSVRRTPTPTKPTFDGGLVNTMSSQ